MVVPNNSIMVVDDQETVCYSLKRLLTAEGYDVETATSGMEAIGKIESCAPDVVVLDVSMPNMDGMQVLKKVKALRPATQIVMMTAYSSTEKAIEATKNGAFDFLLKPFENAALLQVISAAINASRIQRDVVFLPEGSDSGSAEGIVGNSPRMLELYKRIGQIAPTRTPVLLLGETGVGKELMARAIVKHSDRADRPFMTVNCAAIPENLLESEFFGHEKGAFTGASTVRVGKFEQCHNGTLFLDEIGEMPLALQAKLLRVLQDGSFQRLGGIDFKASDARIITATNKNLKAMIREGAFREDLYYRINVITLAIPPLRERKKDISLLVEYFVGKFNKLLSKQVKGVAATTLDDLEQYVWPGNVRELENTIQRAMVLSDSECLEIEAHEIKLHGTGDTRSASAEIKIDDFVEQVLKNSSSGMFQEIVAQVEERLVTKALIMTNGNQVQAAKFLGISRNTLRKKLLKAGIN